MILHLNLWPGVLHSGKAGECERQAIDLEGAVPYQYEETEEEREMGLKTGDNIKSLKKKVMVASLLNNWNIIEYLIEI